MVFSDRLYHEAKALIKHARWTQAKVAAALKVPLRTLKYNLRQPCPTLRKRKKYQHSPASKAAIRTKTELVRKLLTKTEKRKEALPPSTRKNARKPRVQTRKPYGTLSRCRRALWTLHNIPMSKSSVSRYAKKAGLVAKKRPRGPGRYEGDEERRLEYVKKNLQFALSSCHNVLFVDEKLFDTIDTDRFSFCRPGDPAEAYERERFPERVHVFGCVGVGFRFLYVFPEKTTIDGKGYWDNCIEPLLKTLKAGRHLLHDGAGAHKAIEEELKKKKVSVVPHPPRSPDLNPIERVWGLLARKVSQYGPLTRAELVTFVKREFAALPVATLDNICRSWPKMMKSVRQQKGATSCKNIR